MNQELEKTQKPATTPEVSEKTSNATEINQNTSNEEKKPERNFNNRRNNNSSSGAGNFKRRFDKGGSGQQLRRRKNDSRKKNDFTDSNIESQVLEVRRISRTVKGGKRMRFSALVIAGDRLGKVGFGLAKGLDFQDAVAKATKKAKDKLIRIEINEEGSLKFPVYYKFKSAYLYLKPAKSGTGLIAGGFLRPVLQLAGVQNIYSKIVGSNNKVVGVRAAIQALKDSYSLSTASTPNVTNITQVNAVKES
jgi:small subunit ribosomal protein S5